MHWSFFVVECFLSFSHAFSHPCICCMAQDVGSPSHLEECSSHDTLIAVRPRTQSSIRIRAFGVRAPRNRTSTREVPSAKMITEMLGADLLVFELL